LDKEAFGRIINILSVLGNELGKIYKLEDKYGEFLQNLKIAKEASTTETTYKPLIKEGGDKKNFFLLILLAFISGFLIGWSTYLALYNDTHKKANNSQEGLKTKDLKENLKEISGKKDKPSIHKEQNETVISGRR